MRKYIIGFLCGAFFFSGISYAASNNLVAKIANHKFFVSGKEKKLSGNAVSINGKIYIPVTESNNLFGYSVKESKSKIEFIQETSNSGYDKTKLAGIKGTITWQYNDFIGTKGDVGAKIALIPKNLKKSLVNATFPLTLQSTPQGSDGIYTGKADGNGIYNIDDVPAGEYFLLIVSNNTNSDMTIDQYDEQQIKPLFSEENWTNLERNLKLNKYELINVILKENKVNTESHDFGNTYF